MSILKPDPLGQHRETIRLMNEGNEPAHNVYFDELPGEQIKLETIPRIIPVVSPTQPQEIIATFAKEIRPDAIELRTIASHLASEQRNWSIFMVWENPQGIRFRRCFRLERPLLTDYVYCYPGVRELLG